MANGHNDWKRLKEQYTLVILSTLCVVFIKCMKAAATAPRRSVAAISNNQDLIIALTPSCDVDYRKRLWNLYTIIIINANYGTRIVPKESKKHIYHGNDDNSISPNNHLPHYCTEPPKYNMILIAVQVLSLQWL